MNKSEILDLILLKQEGSYWDFKREWYFQDKRQIYSMTSFVWQTTYRIEMPILLSGLMRKMIIHFPL